MSRAANASSVSKADSPLIIAVVQVHQVVSPGVSFLDRIVEIGDSLEVSPIVGQQRVIDTEHPLGLHPGPFQAVQSVT